MNDVGFAPGEDLRQFAGMELVAFQRRLIGRFLTDPASIGPAIDAGLHPKHLEDPRCRRAMRLIKDAFAQGSVVGPAEIFELAQSAGQATPDFDAWLASVAERPLSQDPVELIPLFIQRWQWWQLDQVATILQDEAKLRRMTPLELRQRLTEQLEAMTPSERTGYHVSEVIRECLPLWAGEDQPDLMPTGLTALDRILDGGFEKGDFIILAAPPGCGKTATAISLVDHVAVMNSHPTVFITMEMSRTRIARRQVACRARMSPRALGRRVPSAKMPFVLDHAGVVADAPVTILDGAGWSVATIRSWLQANRELSIEFLVIDQFNKMEHPPKPRDDLSRLATSQGLKTLAEETGLRILLLSQITKEDQRAGVRPTLKSIRDAPIYEDADTVILGYRPEYYLPADEVPEELDGLMELIVAKNRDGETGVARVFFDAPSASVLSSNPRGW